MKLFIVAGERSGDFLGARLIAAMRSLDPALSVVGVGGPAMEREGLESLFPLDDLAIMGFVAVATRLPNLLARIDRTANAVVDVAPDVLVIIDSPDFTHRVARRVKRWAPRIPIVDYVSPKVWAWRPGRARAMCGYIDRVLALFPFEPAAHERLGGPQCTFVGHPLVEFLDELRPNAEEARARAADEATFLIMPGSRRSEIERLMPIFGQVLDRVSKLAKPLDVILPAVAHLEDDIREELRAWPYKPRVVVSDADKLAAFRRARAALVASGTATLELALSGIPMAVAYRVSPIESLARHFIDVPSVVLANLVLGRNVVPEFLQERCTVEHLAAAMTPLVADAPARETQIRAFEGLETHLTPASGEAPSLAAARAVIEVAGEGP